MNKYIDTKGLRFKLWTYFILFTAIIMFVLWTLQTLFLSTQYKHMKLRQINNIGNLLADKYGQEDFNDTIYQLAYKNGLIIRVFNEKGESVLNSNMFGDFRPPRSNPRDIESVINNIKNSDAKIISYTTNDDRVRANIVVFGREIKSPTGEKVFLYINSFLAPIDSATEVLQNQLILVTIISILIAFILSYFLSKKLSRPITHITDSALILATGEYNIVFEENGYKEVNNLARSLNHMAEELTKTDELRRDLIANVSHDLRTPLTIIKSYAEMIRDISGENREKRNAHAKVIVDESDRLSLLVNDILDLSKIESNTINLNFMKFDMTSTVKNILNHFNVITENKGYEFEVEYDNETYVLADEQKIQQVIYNLISNAVNYTGDEKKVYIIVKKISNKVRFEVKDTGEGIPQDELELIWDRYYKSSKTNKRLDCGSGVGLAIVKGILNSHEAKYGVESEINKGSTFWFELNYAR